MKSIAFVLLNYNNIDVTRKSVKYIQSLNQDNFKVSIVIVDNASPNRSGKIIEKDYQNINNIFVILNNENVGFAKGNNIGYLYAKYELKAQCIVVMNTDVYIKDEMFLNRVKLHHDKCEIIAPDIVTKMGSHQNPMRFYQLSDLALTRLYKYNKRMFKIYNIIGLGVLAAFVLEYRNNKQKKDSERFCEIEKKDIIPHGACVIFTEKWISKEDFAFPPVTFMYLEEDILAEYLFSKGYNTLYCPDIQVYHIEDASLIDSYKSRLKKRRFLSKNMFTSAKVLINMRKARKNEGNGGS
jgi:GT2 family glycosyltransferase